MIAAPATTTSSELTLSADAQCRAHISALNSLTLAGSEEHRPTPGDHSIFLPPQSSEDCIPVASTARPLPETVEDCHKSDSLERTSILSEANTGDLQCARSGKCGWILICHLVSPLILDLALATTFAVGPSPATNIKNTQSRGYRSIQSGERQLPPISQPPSRSLPPPPPTNNVTHLDLAYGPIGLVRISYWLLYMTPQLPLALEPGRLIFLRGPKASPPGAFYRIQHTINVGALTNGQVLLATPFDTSLEDLPLALILLQPPCCPPSPELLSSLGITFDPSTDHALVPAI